MCGGYVFVLQKGYHSDRQIFTASPYTQLAQQDPKSPSISDSLMILEKNFRTAQEKTCWCLYRDRTRKTCFLFFAGLWEMFHFVGREKYQR